MAQLEEMDELAKTFQVFKLNRDMLEQLLEEMKTAYRGLEEDVLKIEGDDKNLKHLLLSDEEEGRVKRIFQEPSLMFIGQTNSGKSSLINEILGATIVQAHENPCTSRIVELGYGSNEGTHITITDRQGKVLRSIQLPRKNITSDIVKLSSNNRDNVAEISSKVTAKINNPFLRCGVKMIDSPGKNENKELDSMVDRHMDSVLPLVVYVINGRGTLILEEIEDLKKLQSIVPYGNIFFAVAKCDPETSENQKTSEEFETAKSVETEIKEEVYRKLIVEDLVDPQIPTEYQTYHTLSARRVKRYRISCKDDKKPSKEFERYMKEFIEFKSCLMKFTQKQLIKCISDATKILQCSLMKCLDYFMDLSNNLALEKAQCEKNINMMDDEEKYLNKRLEDEVNGKKKEIADGVTQVLEERKEHINKLALHFKLPKDFEIPEDGLVQNDIMDVYKTQLKKVILDEICLLIQKSVMKTFEGVNRMSEFASKIIADSQERIGSEIPIHDAVSMMLIDKYTFESDQPIFDSKSLLEKIKNYLVNILETLKRKLNNQPTDKFDVSEDIWKEDIAKEALCAINSNSVAEAVINGINDHIARGHNVFHSRLDDLRQIFKTKYETGDRLRDITNQKAPLISRLQLDAWNIIDRLRFGEIKYGELIGEGIFGKLYQCDVRGPNKEPCVVKVIEVDGAGLGQMAMEIHYNRKLNHKHITNVLGTVYDKLDEDKYRLSIILPRLRQKLPETLLELKSAKERLEFAMQVADVLVYLHKKKMMYRDIRLENILLDADKNVQMVDLRCFKPPGIKCMNTKIDLTSEYIAPEIKDNPDTDITLKVDVFAFGWLLFEICMGDKKRPPPGPAGSIACMRPPKVDGLNHYCWELMDKCCQECPKDRPDMKCIMVELDRIYAKL